MYLDDKIGSIAPGMEADIVVLDMKSTPIIDYRMQFAKDLEEALFIQMTLGDDRAVQATYVAGRLLYSREHGTPPSDAALARTWAPQLGAAAVHRTAATAPERRTAASRHVRRAG